MSRPQPRRLAVEVLEDRSTPSTVTLQTPVALGDVNGDYFQDLIVGARQGAPAQVTVYNGKDGSLLLNFVPGVGPSAGPSGGIAVAAGDLDGDGRDEIIVGAGIGSPPLVQVFAADGTSLAVFAAFGGGVRGGISVAAGDVNGDGVDEVVAGTGRNAPALVSVLSGGGGLMGTFRAYARGMTHGVSVAAGDVNGDGLAEVITAPGAPPPGAGKSVARSKPVVEIFNPAGALLGSFVGLGARQGESVTVAAADLNGDGSDEVVTGLTGPRAAPVVIAYGPGGVPVSAFFALPPGARGGLSVAASDTLLPGVGGGVAASWGSTVTYGMPTGAELVTIPTRLFDRVPVVNEFRAFRTASTAALIAQVYAEFPQLYAAQSDWEKVQILREFAHRHTNIAWTRESSAYNWFPLSAGAAERYAFYAANTGGSLCGGTSEAFAELLQLFGIRATQLPFVCPQFNHVVTLAEVRYKGRVFLTVNDAMFNVSLAYENGAPMDFGEITRRLQNHQANTITLLGDRNAIGEVMLSATDVAGRTADQLREYVWSAWEVPAGSIPLAVEWLPGGGAIIRSTGMANPARINNVYKEALAPLLAPGEAPNYYYCLLFPLVPPAEQMRLANP